MRRFVVTGCAGFIGSHLTEALLARGDEVVGVDAFTPYYARAYKEANLARACGHVAFTLHELDLAESSVSPLLEGVHGIFHLAAQPGVRASWGEAFDVYTRNNVMATQHLLEAAARAEIKVVYASSSSIYGEATAFPTPEDVVPLPVSPYGVTKLACEHLAGAYARAAGLRSIGLRYFTVYGPRQRPDMAFARILSALLAGTEFEIYGTGEQSRDFTYVDDAVAATLAVMERGSDGTVYNVGGGAEASLNHVIAELEKLSGRQVAVRRLERATGDVRRTVADTSRIRRDVAWSPRHPLREGIAAQFEAAAQAHGPQPSARTSGRARRVEQAAR